MSKIEEYTHEEKQQALDEAFQIMKMRVFKMNDSDWVAHYSQEDAVNFYSDFTGIEIEEVQEECEEVPLLNTMFWESENVPKEDAEKFEHVPNSPFGDCYLVTFEWVIQNHPELYPGMISSTEY